MKARLILYKTPKPLLLLLIGIIMIALCGFSLGGGNKVQVPVGENQIQVPIIIDLSHPVAGAEITFEYSEGLEFVSFEKSEEVNSSMSTPVVEKNGATILGIFNADNVLVPTDGKLDIGYLVFNYTGNEKQSVNITETKLVEVIDKDTTNSEILDSRTIKISREGQGINPVLIVALILVALAICIAIIIVIKRKKDKKPALEDPLP